MIKLSAAVIGADLNLKVSTKIWRGHDSTKLPRLITPEFVITFRFRRAVETREFRTGMPNS